MEARASAHEAMPWGCARVRGVAGTRTTSSACASAPTGTGAAHRASRNPAPARSDRGRMDPGHDGAGYIGSSELQKPRCWKTVETETTLGRHRERRRRLASRCRGRPASRPKPGRYLWRSIASAARQHRCRAGRISLRKQGWAGKHGWMRRHPPSWSRAGGRQAAAREDFSRGEDCRPKPCPAGRSGRRR